MQSEKNMQSENNNNIQSEQRYDESKSWVEKFKSLYQKKYYHLGDVVRVLNAAKKDGFPIELDWKYDAENNGGILVEILDNAVYCGQCADGTNYDIDGRGLRSDCEDLKTLFKYAKKESWRAYWDHVYNCWCSPLGTIEAHNKSVAIDMLHFLKENNHEIDKYEKLSLSQEVVDAWDELNNEPNRV